MSKPDQGISRDNCGEEQPTDQSRVRRRIRVTLRLQTRGRAGQERHPARSGHSQDK